MRTIGFGLLTLLLAAPAGAQSHADVVAAAKASLQAQGADLSGPCGAFRIVTLAAQQLAAEGAGVLSKPSGNNCDGYATDIIVYRDGRVFDVLVDAGGQNGATWSQLADANADDAARWRVAPGGTVVVPPPDTPPVIVPPVIQTLDLGPTNQRIEAIAAQLERVYGDLINRDDRQVALLQQVDQRVQRHDEDPGWIKKLFTNSNTYVAIAGILGGWIANNAAGN